MPLVAVVVDDSILIRRAVQRYLEERGYRVHAASNGVDALVILDRVKADLIVTDLMMPKMTGTEFIREVRHRAEFANTPIIVVAGRRGSTVPPSGANQIIFKEIDLVEQLHAILEKIAVQPSCRISANGDQAALD